MLLYVNAQSVRRSGEQWRDVIDGVEVATVLRNMSKEPTNER